MNSYKTVKELLTYYHRTRGVGHTTALMRGALKVPSVIVSSKMFHAEEMAKQCKNATPMTIQSIDLIGISKPMVIDNSAMTMLLESVVSDLMLLQNIKNLIKE